MRMHWIRLQWLAIAVLLSGCTEMVLRPQASTHKPVPSTQVRTPATLPKTPTAPANTPKPAVAVPLDDFWSDMVAARRFTDCNYDPAIEGWARRLTASPANFNADVARMLPYFDYVWRRTQALEMPTEVAFLPLVESNYRQVYGSYGSPGGWWQLMPDTGRTFKIDVSRQNDERVDPVKATDVAIKLMQENATRFKQDWLLAIFAYNVGGLRIQRVLESKGLEPGQIEHVRQLNLPLTTEDHLHRLIAWGCIFANPGRYNVSLPAPLTPEQRFTEVRIAHTTPVAAITEVLGGFGPEWQKQHPLIQKRGEIRYGQRILAPASVNADLAALGDLRRFKPVPAPIVARAPTPATQQRNSTAKRTSTQAKRMVAKNTAAKNTVAKNIVVPARFKVRNGDNLWTIARHFDMRVKEILALNPGLTRESVLKLGQVLRLK
jgi:membrane-bound lytic murein transglycosylase D